MLWRVLAISCARAMGELVFVSIMAELPKPSGPDMCDDACSLPDNTVRTQRMNASLEQQILIAWTSRGSWRNSFYLALKLAPSRIMRLPAQRSAVESYDLRNALALPLN